MPDSKVTVIEKKTNIKTAEEIKKENESLKHILEVKPKGEEKMSVMLVDQPDRSVNIGVVGVGQCGSKIAEEFYGLGYSVVAINTATQDLKLVNIPERQKLFLDYALGGAAKDLETGKAAVEENAEKITVMLNAHFADATIMMLVVSGGGGTGSGSAEIMINIMAQLGKPIVVLYVLPLSSEDALSKYNSIQTLSQLAQLAKTDVINSLIVVDNAKIELLYPGQSMASFWKTANQAIVNPLHLFNKLSVNPSEYTSLDPMDFSRLFLGGDCALYGAIELTNYMEDSAISEAIINNLQNGLLSGNFDLAQTRSAGVIITGSKKVLQKLPASNIEFGFAMLNKICNDGCRVFRGVYEVPTNDDVLRIYSFFSGLGLPEARVSELKAEADKHMETLKNKEDNRANSMTIDLGKTGTVNAIDQMHKKILNKNSAMGKIVKNTKKVIDRRTH